MKYGWLVLFLMILNMPLAAYSQCADIFKQGVALMEAKKYKSAISYFQKAQKCDKSLAKQCNERINECRRYLKIVPSKALPSFVITLDKQTLDFTSEETSAKTVKVTSEADWDCTSDETWCTVTKMDKNRLAIECDINKTTDDRTAIIQVKNEKKTEHIKVIQKGMEAILRFAPNLSLEFGKEGVDYLKIPLNCTMNYKIDSKPEWVTVFEEYTNMIVVKIEPMKRTDKDREGQFCIVSSDGTQKDYVKIKQYKKLPKPDVKETDDEKKESKKKGKRKTALGN